MPYSRLYVQDTEHSITYCVVSDCTFEKIDLLFSVVSWCRQSKRCIHMIRNFVKTHTDIPRVVIVQHTIVKPPVFASLTE